MDSEDVKVAWAGEAPREEPVFRQEDLDRLIKDAQKAPPGVTKLKYAFELYSIMPLEPDNPEGMLKTINRAIKDRWKMHKAFVAGEGRLLYVLMSRLEEREVPLKGPMRE